jgi:glycerol-3-phosphate acyltransferase PlsY
VAPWAIAVAFVVWILVVYLTGYVSLGSVIAAALYPAAVYLLHPAERPVLWVHLILAGAIVWFHRANLARLRQGTENRFGRRRREAAG